MPCDDGEKIVEVGLRDVAGQLTYGFHLLCLGETPFAFPAMPLDVLAVAQIVDDAGEVALTFG